MKVKAAKINLISGMAKEATPAWVRALAKGGLSKGNIEKLITSLPADKTRLLKNINNKPKLLGAGGEGRVYESFTGGHGPSALKLLSARPSALNESRVEAVKNLFSSSDIFPQILATIRGGRGYAIPRLNPLPAPVNPLKELLSLPSSNKQQWMDFVKRFQKATLEPGKVSIPDAKRFGSYGAGGLPNTALMRTAKGPADVSDIKGSGNVMFNQTGRPYLVDPWINNI